MRPAKVLHLINHTSPVETGYTVRTNAILAGLRSLGIQSVAATAPDFVPKLSREQRRAVPAERILHDALHLHHIRPAHVSLALRLLELLGWMRGAWRLSQAIQTCEARRFYRRAASRGFDLFHAHSPYQNAVYAEWLSSCFSKPFIYEMRGLWEESDAACGATTEEEYLRRRQAETDSALKANRVVAISKALKRELENRGVPSEKIDVVPNGVNTGRFVPRLRNTELAERLGVQGRAVFGYISLLRRFEGVDVLVEAAARILSRRGDAACLVVGDGPDMERIRRLVQQTSKPQSIVLTGRVPHADVLDYYSLIDVFVVPRLRAPVTEMVTPIKPLEAMCMGKAVVVSDVGGLTELVQDGETGLTFPAGDAEALAETLETLLDNPDLRSGLGERARRWVLAERDWSRVCQGYVDVYTRALDSHTPAEPAGAHAR